MTKTWVVAVVLLVVGACGGRIPEAVAGPMDPCPCVPAGAREAGDDAACFSCLQDAGTDAGAPTPGA